MKNKRMLYPDLLWILTSFPVVLIHVFSAALFYRILKPDLISTMPILGMLLSTAGIFLLSALTVRVPSRLPLTKKLV